VAQRSLRLGVLLALALLFISLLAPQPAQAGTPGAQTVRIEASRYRFDPGVVDVRRGARVTLELVAADVVHGLYLDGYGLAMTADPGQTARLTFVADRAGTFRFRCSVSCGAMHPFMVGKLRVGPDLLGWSNLLWAGAALASLALLAAMILGEKKRAAK
jgi:heme/copper-type cytochrome/quinol oxidase subunit 2